MSEGKSMHPLAIARNRCNLSQKILAELAGVSLPTVQRAEAGKSIRADCRHLLCDYFSSRYDRQVEPQELGLVYVEEGEERQESSNASYTHEVSYTNEEEVPKQETESYDIVNRRDAIKKIGTTSVLLMMPQTLLDPDEWDRLTRALAKPSYIDTKTLEGLQRTIESYWRLRIRGSVTSPDLLNAALGHFQLVRQLLQGSHLPTTRTNLCTIVSDIGQLIGRLLVDMHRYDAARFYYKSSLVAAQQSNNDVLYAVGLARMGTPSAISDNLQEALLFLQEAQHIVAHSNAYTLQAWLASEKAEIQADAQDSNACFKSLDQAAHFTDLIKPEDENMYGIRSDASRLLANQGACYMRLHQPHLALPALQAGLKMPEPSDALIQSILLDMATASVQAGEIEQACSYISQSLEIIARLHAARFIQRAHKLRKQLEPWSAVQAVKDVDERLLLFKSITSNL